MGVMADRLVTDTQPVTPVRNFGAWMADEQKRVFLLCYRMLQDRDEADSVTQDVFLKAYKSFQKGEMEQLDDPAKWLTRVAVNTCLDVLRSRRWKFWRQRPKQQDEELILKSTSGGEPSAEDQVFARQIQQRLTEAIAKLSDRQRAVFTLRHFEDYAMDEIARTLGLDVGTVKAHMARAMAKMREELKDLYRAKGAAAGSAVVSGN